MGKVIALSEVNKICNCLQLFFFLCGRKMLPCGRPMPKEIKIGRFLQVVVDLGSLQSILSLSFGVVVNHLHTGIFH